MTCPAIALVPFDGCGTAVPAGAPRAVGGTSSCLFMRADGEQPRIGAHAVKYLRAAGTFGLTALWPTVDFAISELVSMLVHPTTPASLTLAMLFSACQPANPLPHHVFAPPPVMAPQGAVDTTGLLDDDADPQPDGDYSDATPKISIDQAIADLGTVAEIDPPRQGSPATSPDWLDAREDGVDFDKSSLCFAADGQAKPVAIADLCSNVEAKMTGMDRAAS